MGLQALALCFIWLTKLLHAACPITYAQSPMPPTLLYVVNDTEISKQTDLVAIQSLGGALAKQMSPMIYRVADPSSPYSDWLSDIEAKTDVQINWDFSSDVNGLISELLNKYSSSMAGVAVYSGVDDVSLADAVTFAAGSRGVFAVPSDDANYYLTNFNLPVVFNASTDEFPTDLVFSENAVVFQQDGAQMYLIEYAVFAAAPFMSWSDPKRDPTLQRLQQVSNGCAAAFGWVGDEGTYVQHLTSYGVWAHASDWAKNIAPLSNIPIAFEAPSDGGENALHRSQRALRGKSTNVHTATFVLTDGDNLQWMLGGFTGESWFGSSSRADTPMSFTLAPALGTLSPAVLSNIYDTVRSDGSASNTSFVAAPSGIGYMYPEEMSDAVLSEFAEQTAAAMSETGMRIVNILAGGDDLRDSTLLRSSDPFLSYDNVDAVFYYTYGSGYAGGGGKALSSDSGKPIITARFSLWDDTNDDPSVSPMLSNDGMIQALNEQDRDMTTNAGYSVVAVHAWSHTTADVSYIMSQLQEGVEVLNAKAFLQRYVDNVVSQ